MPRGFFSMREGKIFEIKNNAMKSLAFWGVETIIDRMWINLFHIGSHAFKLPRREFRNGKGY